MCVCVCVNWSKKQKNNKSQNVYLNSHFQKNTIKKKKIHKTIIIFFLIFPKQFLWKITTKQKQTTKNWGMTIMDNNHGQLTNNHCLSIQESGQEWDTLFFLDCKISLIPTIFNSSESIDFAIPFLYQLFFTTGHLFLLAEDVLA